MGIPWREVNHGIPGKGQGPLRGPTPSRVREVEQVVGVCLPPAGQAEGGRRGGRRREAERTSRQLHPTNTPTRAEQAHHPTTQGRRGGAADAQPTHRPRPIPEAAARPHPPPFHPHPSTGAGKWQQRGCQQADHARKPWLTCGYIDPLREARARDVAREGAGVAAREGAGDVASFGVWLPADRARVYY